VIPAAIRRVAVQSRIAALPVSRIPNDGRERVLPNRQKAQAVKAAPNAMGARRVVREPVYRAPSNWQRPHERLYLGLSSILFARRSSFISVQFRRRVSTAVFPHSCQAEGWGVAD